MVTKVERLNDGAEATGLAVGYIRLAAVDDDARTQVNAQKLAIEHLAEELGTQVVDWYVDLESSGRDWYRLELQRLLADVQSEDRVFDRVLVYRVNRLSRRAADLNTVFQRLEDAGIELITVR